MSFSFLKFCKFCFTGKIFYIIILFFSRLTLTPQNMKFRSRQAIITFANADHASKFFFDIPGKDVASDFLFLNKDRVIKLFVTRARKPVVPLALPVIAKKPTPVL